MPPIAPRWRSPARKALSRCSTRTLIWRVPHIQALPPDIFQAIAQHGIRNALLTSIAPTGTISLFADNVSSGVEPVFALSYSRKVLQPDGSKSERSGRGLCVAQIPRALRRGAALPDYFVTAQTLSPADHLAVQAAAQPFIDSAISKTINVPEAIAFEDFKRYLSAAPMTMGCKGCTTYRPNDITGSVLSVTPEVRSAR